MTITVFLSRSPVLLDRGPSFSRTWSSFQYLLFNCNCSIGGPKGLLCWVLVFSTHLISNSSEPQLLNRGSWGPPLLGASFLYRILSPTRMIFNCSNFLCTKLYNSSTPTFSCGRHKSHSFNPSTVKVIFWYSSTGCTCYWHRCISYFDSLAGVNIQH